MRISSEHLNSGAMHTIHPLTKLYLTISVIALSFIPDLILQIVLALVVVLLSLLSPQRWHIFKRFLRYIFPVVILILLLNVFFFPESQRTVKLLGMSVNEAGFMFGLGVSSRLSIISLSLLFFFTTTPASLLSTALLMKGANPRVVYVFVYSIQQVETLRWKIQKVWVAQASRGLQVKGNPLKRLKAFFPMLLPLIFSYLAESLERGLALELRGLGVHGPKSFLMELKESKGERIANWVLILGTIIIILWKALRWLIL